MSPGEAPEQPAWIHQGLDPTFLASPEGWKDRGMCTLPGRAHSGGNLPQTVLGAEGVSGLRGAVTAGRCL